MCHLEFTLKTHLIHPVIASDSILGIFFSLKYSQNERGYLSYDDFFNFSGIRFVGYIRGGNGSGFIE
ncbi:hypothetical protein NPIL_89431 [Nephila pilipes]|uniref:Uncharacterized protein n=1 Tax=Nephila pilipes TaxID=299642 RepID=A0A8X6TAV3_NEPPI|nr:hypothetical protein NPIL_89431 [Nephila pilipes]